MFIVMHFSCYSMLRGVRLSGLNRITVADLEQVGIDWTMLG